MVQGQYGLRARAVLGRRRYNELSASDLQQPAAAATISAGLQPGIMTKAERLAFGGRHAEYLDARSMVLEKWYADPTRYLSADDCAAAAGPTRDDVVREAHLFLQEQGGINTGLLQNDPLAAAAATPAVTTERIAAETLRILRSVDMAATTERMIRKQLETSLGVKVDEHKDFIRSQVLAFIQGKASSPAEAAPEEKPAKVKGRVIIVGAGPAGLAAAMHLKRCGVDSVVLEARTRMGGRVCTHRGGGFSVPIDLGASIITGISVDLAKGARADPSAVIARQLGVELHGLGRMLPIFDGETGAPVAPETDARIEGLVNHLLDTAREGVDEADDDPARPDSSLGAALDSALAAHLSAAAGAAEADAAGADAAESSEGAADLVRARMGDAGLADETAGTAEVGAEGAAREAAGAGAADAGAAEASAAGAGTAEPDALGAGLDPRASAEAGAAMEGHEQQAQGAAGGAAAGEAGEPGPVEAGERAMSSRGAGAVGADEPAEDACAAVGSLQVSAQLALAASGADPAAEGMAGTVAPLDPGAGLSAPMEPGSDASAGLPAASTLHEAAAGDAGPFVVTMDAAGPGCELVAANGGPSLSPASTTADAAERGSIGEPSTSAAGPADPASGAAPAEEAPAPRQDSAVPFAGPLSPAGDGRLGKDAEEPATVAAPAMAPASGDPRAAVTVPAVGPAAGVSGAALGEATTAAAEAVAKAYELHQDAGSAATTVPVELPRSLSEAERRLLNWHWANLEYGCSARLDQVSLAHWNQDDEYGGFGGAHAMVHGGYSGLLEPLAARLDVRLGAPVARIMDTNAGVRVTTASGEVFDCAAAIVTVPLGCLKAGSITFDPPLPDWKASAISKLGFGNLNKIVLEFPEAFWDADMDYFGAALPGGTDGRGRCFMFWNLQRFTGAPVLVALVAGAAAGEAEAASDAEMGAAAVQVLRRVYGADVVPEPRCVLATRWASEEYTRGSYSYVAVGASGRTYDQLAAPVRRRLLFAGEHTCKEHPDTVGGAMLTGVREAVRALSLLRGDDAGYGAAAADDVATGPLVKRRVAQAEKERRPRKRHAEDDDSGDERNVRIYRDPAVMAAEEAHRERERDHHRQLWVALMAGDTLGLEGLLLECTDAAARGALAAELARARVGMLSVLADHLGCLRALNIWLLDLVADQRAFHVLELVLQVLRAMPVQWGLLKQSGVAATVRQRGAEHPNRAVRAAVAAVTQHWANAVGDASLATALPQAAAPASAAPARRDALTPSPSEEAAEVLDEGVRLRLAEADAAAQEAAMLKEQAALVEAAVVQAQATTEAAREMAVLPDIPDFSDYAGELRRQRPSRAGREAKLARRKARAEKALAKVGDGAADEPAAAAAPAPAGVSGRTSASREGTASASVAGKTAKVKREVTEYVKTLLKPLYAAKRITKEHFKLVVEKSASKVAEQAADAGSSPFLNDKRQAKVRALVEKYLKRHAGGAGGST